MWLIRNVLNIFHPVLLNRFHVILFLHWKIFMKIDMRKPATKGLALLHPCIELIFGSLRKNSPPIS